MQLLCIKGEKQVFPLFGAKIMQAGKSSINNISI